MIGSMHTQKIGYLLTAVGIVGIFVSFAIQQSEIDPIAISLATVSILVSIIGIALALQTPSSNKSNMSKIQLGPFGHHDLRRLVAETWRT